MLTVTPAKKIDYVLNEKVCKNDSSVTFISNSFHAAPAEKPVPKSKDDAKQKDIESLGSGDGNTIPSSSNVGTVGSYKKTGDSFSPCAKRAGSPLNREGRNSFKSARSSFNSSAGYQDDGGGDEDDAYFEDQKPILDSESGLVKEEAL